MRLVSPHQSLMFAAVAGTVDTTYQASWLTDGRAGFPAKTTGNLSLAVTPAAAQLCDVFAVHHHSIRQAATIALTGDVTNSIPTAAHPPNAIPHNWFRLLEEPVSISTVTLGITGNTDPVIASFYAGLSFAPECGLRAGVELDPGQVRAMLGEHGIITPHDDGVSEPRGRRGELLLSAAEFAALLNLREAQRKGSRPCLYIPDDAVNDAWLCLVRFTDRLEGGHHFVTIELAEIPRLRWPA